MADFAETQLEIEAVIFALNSFVDYESEEERRNFLRQNFSAVPRLKNYFDYTKNELKNEKKLLLEKDNLLLAQKHGSIRRTDESISNVEDLFTFIQKNRGGRPLEKPTSLAQVYNMVNAPDSVHGFGSEFRGQENAGKTLAKYVDERFRLVQMGATQVKENFKQPVCVHGVGCGKSALLSNGLALQKKYCNNKMLQELLKDENNPLAIHITFNSETPFSHKYEKDIDLAVIRRILATCLGLVWDVAILLPLGESLRVNDCVRAIIAYHKTVHGMRDDQKLFVYLGVDEINQLVHYANVGAKPDIASLKNLARAVRGLSPPNGFVSTLLAGTHFADMMESFLGSGISPLNLELTKLSEDDIRTMLLTDAGVDQKYFDNPNFKDLLDGIGPVMRGIGIAISELEYEYNPESILRARYAVTEYLRKSVRQLSLEEMKALYGLVLTGIPVSPLAPLSNDSFITLDSLQNSGTVFLNPSPEDSRLSSVLVSRFMLESFFQIEPRPPIVSSAKLLLSFIDSHGPDSFEKFVAHFHGMKKAVFLERSLSSVPVKLFFSGALIGDGLLNQEIELIPASVSVSLDFHDTVMWWRGKRYPETEEIDLVSHHLKNGGVLLNSKGAAIDVLSCERVRVVGEDWQEGVIAYGMKHTQGETELSWDDVSKDLDKAVKVLRASENHSKALVTMVHFSNRDLSKELLNGTRKKELGRSVVVGQQNIESVVGPLFGRLLTSKGFYGIGGGLKPKSYSTLAGVGVSWMRRLFR